MVPDQACEPPNKEQLSWYPLLFFWFLDYLSVSSAGITFQVTKVTGGVLQAEASLMSLRNFTASADLK